MKATLTRSGATGYSTANWKSYDVWGGERASTGSGSMFGYGGNLGHPTDPENGLIYMRARFYEPWTGRFLSEDPAHDGRNWYAYCANLPSTAVDSSGTVVELIVGVLLDEFLKTADGASKTAAQNYSRMKIQDACSYWAGRLLGELIANDLDELFGMVTSRGFAIGNESGGIFIDFDGTNHGGKIHIDTWGRIKHYIQSTCKTGNYRIDLFMKGLKDSLID